MKKIVSKILFFITLLLSGHSPAAMITWDTTSNFVGENDIFTLDILGTDFVSNVDGGGIDFSFDSSVLNVLSVSIDELVWDFVSGIQTGTINNVAGTVDSITVFASSAVTGDFTVASVEFQVVGSYPSNSALTLSEYALNPWASGGSAINPDFVSGNVSVVPVPAAAWLFGSGLIGLIGVARCKKA